MHPSTLSVSTAGSTYSRIIDSMPANKFASKRPRGAAAASASCDGNNYDADGNPLSGMTIACALQQNDTTTLGSTLKDCLPGGKDAVVTEIVISKSLGEAFTGGRSTPVYYITCKVMRPGWDQPKERHFVAKLVIMEGDASTNAKLSMKRESYAVERRFYDVAAPRIRDDVGACGITLEIPRLLASDRDGSKSHPAVCFFMNDIRSRGFPRHPEFLSVSEAERALKWIARLHAIFWNDEKSQNWRRDLWTRGGFWTDGKDAVNIQTISAQWTQTVKWLQTHHPELVSEEVKAIGKRIQALAGPLDRFLSMESTGPRGTMTHGDYKAANLFLSESRADDDMLGAESVAVVDFQFAGGGLGAEDVSYLLFSDARGHYFNDEEELLQVYHEELVTSLIEQRKGGPSSISLDCLKMQYELSRIDFTRHLLGRGWVASTEGDALLVRALAETLIRIDGGSPLGSEGEYFAKLGSLCEG